MSLCSLAEADGVDHVTSYSLSEVRDVISVLCPGVTIFNGAICWGTIHVLHLSRLAGGIIASVTCLETKYPVCDMLSIHCGPTLDSILGPVLKLNRRVLQTLA